jgi:C4-dicarboxylate transporter, DctM subunit
MMTAVLLLALAAGLIALRQPIVAVLAAIVIVLYMVWQDGNPVYVAYDIWRAVNNEAFIAIPLFMLAGAIMSKGSIAERLIDFIKALTRPIPGGLAVAVVLACIGFGSVSGSSAATLMAVGGIMYPALLKASYSKRFSIGLVCASATLGVIVPPSILMILLGIVGSAPGRPMSIQDLFVGGLLPALLLAVMLALYAMITHAHLRGGWWSLSEIGRTFWRAAFALLVPAAILGGIYSGAFTATEAAAIAVLLAIIIELVLHRDLTLAGLRDVAIETSRLLGSLFPLIALAVSVNIFLTWEGVPQAMARELGAMIHSKTEFILYSNVLLLILGALLDEGSAVLIFAPLLLPLAETEGMHPVHFGVMMIVNLQIGYLTPPVGLNLMIASAAFRESFWDVCKAVIPFIVILLIGVAIVAMVPQLTLWNICAQTPAIAACQ